jgi:hypothetical protein
VYLDGGQVGNNIAKQRGSIAGGGRKKYSWEYEEGIHFYYWWCVFGRCV